ncbi:MAG TPA: hypothetical protein HA254_01440 [Candidatus Diapherotrites archaeon]|uniref:Uncharacterized protein n=1 Tax=Candidatus Iainarchaeum sp. TaxID=3101447 RepID=A0A7J4IV43_9ARCH|nr:hypothetical protein [Candidatus Diapherotrites archaeon]
MFRKIMAWYSGKANARKMRKVPYEFRRNTLPSWTENSITLQDIKRMHGVDIVQLIKDLGKPRPRVLDSGTGLLKMAIGLKEHFRDNIFVEALTLHRPEKMTPAERKDTEKEKQHLEESLRRPDGKDAISRKYSRQVLERLRKHDADLQDTLQKMRLVDRISIAYLEYFTPEGTYDVIIDYFGPGTHGNRKKVWKKYFEITSPESIIISSSVPYGRFSKFFKAQPIGKAPTMNPRLFLVKRAG